MPAENSGLLASLLDRVRQIEPVLRTHSATGESQRRLADDSVKAMRENGLFRLWKPREFGGLEVDPMTAFRVFEEVSRIDSAAGWNLQLSCGVDPFAAWFSDEGAKAVFGDPNAILAGAFFPPRKALAVEGGFTVTGQTPFASGAHHCSWLLGLAHVYDADRLRLGADGQPITLMTACPATDIHILDTWNTLGMRGTGSHDIVMNEVLVPQRCTAPLVRRTTSASAYRGPLYRFTAWTSIAALSTTSLGIAQAAIDEFVDLAGKKTPAYTVKNLKDRSTVQMALGQAQAMLGSARAYLYEALRDFWDRACQGEFIDMPSKIKLQLAGTHAAACAVNVVDLVQSVIGTSGVRQEYRFERHFRDVHTIAHHGYIAPSRYESVGQLLFGVPVEWPFYSI
jgi:indole-3-acetate monooxygenase